MQQSPDLQTTRLHRLEQLTTVLVEGQSSTVQILQEHSNRMDSLERRMERVENRLERVENRLEKVEELLALALDDLAFIKEILQRGNPSRS